MHPCSLMDHGGSVEAFFVQMVQIIIDMFEEVDRPG